MRACGRICLDRGHQFTSFSFWMVLAMALKASALAISAARAAFSLNPP